MKKNNLLFFLIAFFFFNIIYYSVSEQQSEQISSASVFMNYLKEFQKLSSESINVKDELNKKESKLVTKIERLEYSNLYSKIFALLKLKYLTQLPLFITSSLLLISILGYIIFVYLKRRRITWLFTSESMERLIWFLPKKTEQSFPNKIWIVKLIFIALFIFLAIGIITPLIKIKLLPITPILKFESATPVLKEYVAEIKKELKPTEKVLTPKEILEQTYEMLILNQDKIGKKLQLPELPPFSKTYLNTIIQVVVGEPLYFYITGAIASELGYDKAIEMFNKYLIVLSEKSQISNYNSYTLGVLLFLLENNQFEKLRNFIKTTPWWSNDVNDYLILAKESLTLESTTLSDEILDTGLIQFDDERESYFLLLEERFKTYSKDKQKSVIEAYAIRHKDDFSDCLAAANFCYNQGLSDFAEKFLSRNFELAKGVKEIELILPLSLKLYDLSKTSEKLEYFASNRNIPLISPINISEMDIPLEKQIELGEEISLGTLIAIFQAYSGKEVKSVEMMRKVLKQTLLSFPYSKKKELYDIYCSLIVCDKIKNETLLPEVKSSVEERSEKDIVSLKNYISKMRTNISLIKKEILIADIKIFLISILRLVGIIMFVIPLFISLLGAWISCGAISDLRLLTFFTRFTELLGFQYCIMIVYLPHGIILILLAQIIRLIFGHNEYFRQTMISRNYRLLE